jgi:uncharacterized protein YodC (DUF2158 family)
MSLEQFKVGDVVQLKSGGPRMTIMRVEDGGYYFCKWFDNKGAIGQGEFPGAALIEVPEDSDFIGVA